MSTMDVSEIAFNLHPLKRAVQQISMLAISSPVSKMRAKTFGSSSICFRRMLIPLPKTVSELPR
jgi:hypothetical protein